MPQTTYSPQLNPPIHITFKWPVRVMLMDKSTALGAVTGTIVEEKTGDRVYVNVLVIKPKMLFPILGGPISGSMTIQVAVDNIAGLVEVKP